MLEVIYRGFNYRVDKTLDTMLNLLLKKEITSINYGYGKYFVKIVFDDKYSICAWNDNKYYAWLSQGTIITKDNISYSWQKKRPRAYTMNQLRKRIEYYHKTWGGYENRK